MSNKERILLVAAPISTRGGTIRRLALWAKHLSSYYEIRILCHAIDPSGLDMLRREGAEVINSSGLSRNGRIWLVPGVKAIRGEIVRYRPNAVISMFLWTDFLTALGRVVKYKRTTTSIPHIIHIAGDPAPFGKSSFAARIYKRIISFSFRSCDMVISICQHDADMIIGNFRLNRGKVHIIPIGIETGLVRAKERVHRPFAFGVISRLSPVKHVDAIIRSFKVVHDRVAPTVQLQIFGDGEELSSLILLSRTLGIADAVIFNGYVDNPYPAFDAIDCLVMFSETEGTPRSILEAALRGVPTIAKNVGGIGEVIEDGVTGFLIANETELIEKMTCCAVDQANVTKMGAQAASFISKRHSIQREIEDLCRILESLPDVSIDASHNA